MFTANRIFSRILHVPRHNERDYKLSYLTFRSMLSVSTLVKSRITPQHVYTVTNEVAFYNTPVFIGLAIIV